MGLEWQWQTRMAGSGEWRYTSVRVVWVASRRYSAVSIVDIASYPVVATESERNVL
jgi:hypothetical protein